MAHMFWQALGLRNVYVYIIYLVRTQLSLNDSVIDVQTRKFQAIVSHVDRGSGSKLDSLHLTDGKKWGQRSLGQAHVRWPHRFKSGSLVEIEWKIRRLDGGVEPREDSNESCRERFMVLLLLGVSCVAGVVASALFHIEGPGVHAQLFSITNGPPEVSWVGLIVFIFVFIGLWRPLLNHLERLGSWGIWETPRDEHLH